MTIKAQTGPGAGGPEIPFLYWTWEEFQRFLVDNDLVITDGLGMDDEFALTAKAEELFAFLGMALHVGGRIQSG